MTPQYTIFCMLLFVLAAQAVNLAIYMLRRGDDMDQLAMYLKLTEVGMVLCTLFIMRWGVTW